MYLSKLTISGFRQFGLDDAAAELTFQPRVTALIGKNDNERPGVDALTHKVSSSSAKELEANQNERTRLQTELNRKTGVLQTVENISENIVSLEERYASLGEISNLVNGNNERKVRLPDFAIAAMFDQVPVTANLRFGPMSNVVQQNSGGIKLDAIFIDEGFGTLDDETLNTALETLHSLTNEMRVVGLISHTEQVKTLITAGFDIEVTPTVSHIHSRAEAA